MLNAILDSNTHQVEMSAGQKIVFRGVSLIGGGTLRAVALSKSMFACACLTEVALRGLGEIKTIFIGGAPSLMPELSFLSSPFQDHSVSDLLMRCMPCVVTAVLSAEAASFFFGKEGSGYQIAHWLPVNIRFPHFLSRIRREGVNKVRESLRDRALGTGLHPNGADSSQELMQEILIKYPETGRKVIEDLDNAEKERCIDTEQKAASMEEKGRQAVSVAVSTVFGGMLRLIALQQTLLSGLRATELVHRGLDLAKYAALGTWENGYNPQGPFPEFLSSEMNRILGEYNYRLFENKSSLGLVAEVLPYAITGVAIWEVANIFFGKPPTIFNAVRVFPLQIRQDSLPKIFANVKDLKSLSQLFRDRVLGQGEFQGNTRSVHEIALELRRRYGEKTAEPIISELEKLKKV